MHTYPEFIYTWEIYVLFLLQLYQNQNSVSNYPFCIHSKEYFPNSPNWVNRTHLYSQIRGKLSIKYDLSKTPFWTFLVPTIWRLKYQKRGFISPIMHLLGLLLKALQKPSKKCKNILKTEQLPEKNLVTVCVLAASFKIKSLTILL